MGVLLPVCAVACCRRPLALRTGILFAALRMSLLVCLGVSGAACCVCGDLVFVSRSFSLFSRPDLCPFRCVVRLALLSLH